MITKEMIEKIYPKFEERITFAARMARRSIENINTPIVRVKSERIAEEQLRMIGQIIHELKGEEWEQYIGWTQIGNPEKKEALTFVTNYAEEKIRSVVV